MNYNRNVENTEATGGTLSSTKKYQVRVSMLISYVIAVYGFLWIVTERSLYGGMFLMAAPLIFHVGVRIKRVGNEATSFKLAVLDYLYYATVIALMFSPNSPTVALLGLTVGALLLAAAVLAVVYAVALRTPKIEDETTMDVLKDLIVYDVKPIFVR